MSSEANQYRLGVIYVALSALSWSLSGLFMRAITADLPTILFLRGLVSGTAIFILFFVMEGRNGWRILRAIRGPTILATLFSSASMISGLGSIYYTSVADAMVIYATVPFVTAGLAFLLIGEKASRATLVASVVAFGGVAVMLTDIQGGGSLLGKGLAGVMTLTVAALAVVMRQYRSVPMMPAMALSAYLCSFVTFWFATPSMATGNDILLIVMFGIIQNALGLSLYTFGAKRIPAADASLLTALEVPMTPLWVWIFMGEVPPHATMIGGPIVLVALFGHIFFEVRRNRDPIGAAAQPGQ
ncbi:DMT family transporter [Neorhizobium alkalisoli]|uniref:EamA domain-containing membrane protein RarD n=1 Tax=Neorhizobium alkalisoli TaxID=528178 RepID=A0A561QR29_9HYPH|nr:DMT family transporter [Neorhizobium alkalisoli]TWF52787.1 EamA domain-containing membrane protein RarD [Neorhizobium alkalisoli]